MTDAFFRAGVGACIFDADGKVLVMERKSPASWQMPQGGIAWDEDPLAALHREVAEETGLTRGDFEVVSRVDGWIAYELPPQYRNAKVGWGQVHAWYLCRLVAPRAAVRPDGVEFTRAEWVAPRDVVERAAMFRKAAYRRVMEALGTRRS